MSRSSRRNGWRNRAMQPPQIPALPEVAGVAGEWVSVLREIRQGLDAARAAAVGPAPIVPSGALVRPAFDGPWRAFVSSSSATTFTVVDQHGNPPRILSSAANNYVGAIVEFLGPGLLTGTHTTIRSVSFANNVLTVTVGDNLPAPVMSGDQFILLGDPLAGSTSPYPAITGLTLLASGTINCNDGDTSEVLVISQPSTIPQNLVILINNQTDEAISAVEANTMTSDLPGGPWTNIPMNTNLSKANVGSGQQGSAWLLASQGPNPFSGRGGCKIEWIFAASLGAAGTLGYAIYGY